ncbi:AAA family ATPase [Myxococcus stipitatus]|uniref:AAA family ATPase n=1 Tax=Myxococcus stipitatus TaxID=83455 RepID=UPI001F393944|nr:AAA family ATPase [Myxococcus stipitatus]MCE9674058.1 AAA family ATPase [Myxococcus stipitatus]
MKGADLHKLIDDVARASEKELGALRGQVESMQLALEDRTSGARSSEKQFQARLDEIAKELSLVAQGEVFRTTLEGAVASFQAVARQEIEVEREEARKKLQRSREDLQEELARVTSRVDKSLKELREQADDLQFTVEERRKLVRDYKPGTIEELIQRIRALREQVQELENERAVLKKEREDLSLQLKLLQSSQGHISQEELEARRKALDERAAQFENAYQVQVERDALRKQLDEMELVRGAYERNQQVVLSDAKLRTQNDELIRQLEQLRQEKDDVQLKNGRLVQTINHKDKRIAELGRTVDEQVKSLMALEAGLADKGTRVQELEASIETERERLRNQLASLQTKNAKLDERQRRLDEDGQRAFAARVTEREQLTAWLQNRKQDLDLVEQNTEETVRRRVAAENAQRLSRLEQDLETAKGQVVGLEQARTLLESRLSAATTERVRFLDEKAGLEAQAERTRQEVMALEKRAHEAGRHLTELKPELAALGARKAALQAENEIAERGFSEKRQREKAELDALIERRTRLEDRTTNLDERLKPIKKHWEAPLRRGALEGREELGWLDDVAGRIEQTGFQFPLRLMKAFHTSLKIASWAPLTALAGVSGTGKSELPRLYAHYGGLRFLSVPVQPNWDSPQDLFGFFNYMDGRFRATDLVRALYQSQQPPGEEGFADGLLLVLLDEMNRARFELYFSELLSRLESRRGAGSDDERSMQVDLGAGVEPLRIRLGENVLFVGTMNEDESTYSLSDMVLDRGNVLSFPRPRQLRRRDSLQTVTPRAQVLRHATWSGWIREPGALPDKARDAIGGALEQLNSALAHVNRAIGHRVLQAVEGYVANYPGALGDERVWKTALEDQLAQKIMPKLRGIELDSQAGGECLDVISRVLEVHAPALRRDFERSRARSQGAFIWSSATYLEGEGEA